MNKEKLQGVELENDQPQNRVTIPQHEEIMDALNRLDMMTVGQADRLFCNSFLSEAVRLLKNSIFSTKKATLIAHFTQLDRLLRHATICFILRTRENLH